MAGGEKEEGHKGHEDRSEESRAEVTVQPGKRSGLTESEQGKQERNEPQISQMTQIERVK